MGLLDRITMLLRANLNDMLDQAEDPEVMLNQVLRDMEDSIGQARTQVASMMAQQKMLEGDVADAQQQAQGWNDRATAAVRQGRDDLAREALARMNDANTHVTLYQQQLEAQQALVTRLRTQLDALQQKYQDAFNNKDALIARHRRAQAQTKVTTATQAASTTDPTSELARMEQRIRGEEAQSAANAELADSEDPNRFADLDQVALNQQLADLKQRLGMGTPPPAAADTSSSPAGSATQKM